MSLATERRRRLAQASLYLITPLQPNGRPLAEVLAAALDGGVDIVQLRDKEARDDELLVAAWESRRPCDEHGALLILNDRPDLVMASGADGCHVGHDDVSVARARRVAGKDALVGRSTHSAADIAAAQAAGADYIGVGPVHATPTKPGREPVGLDLVRHAAAHATVPFFAIGGIEHANVAAVLAAGARRIAVVRAIACAADPRAAAIALRAAIAHRPVANGRA